MGARYDAKRKARNEAGRGASPDGTGEGRNDGSETARAELDEICDSVMKQLYVEAFADWSAAGPRRRSRSVQRMILWKE